MRSSLQTKYDSERLTTYDGTQLAPHWIYRNVGLEGDALMAWVGGANVTLGHMVDLEDVKRKAPIYSPKMLHFLGEWFIDSLEQGILYQHYLALLTSEKLLQHGIQDIERRGNDIFVKERKLNVSIATRSPLSVLVHVGINVETEGTPVPTVGLRELGVEPESFGATLLESFRQDFGIWQKARVKVLAKLA